jgi:serine/threonine protein kinase
MRRIGRHPNIIEYKEYGSNATLTSADGATLFNIPYLALELAINKTLLAYINMKRQNSTFIEEKWTRYWFRQLLSGLEHMNA